MFVDHDGWAGECVYVCDTMDVCDSHKRAAWRAMIIHTIFDRKRAPKRTSEALISDLRYTIILYINTDILYNNHVSRVI